MQSDFPKEINHLCRMIIFKILIKVGLIPVSLMIFLLQAICEVNIGKYIYKQN